VEVIFEFLLEFLLELFANVLIEFGFRRIILGPFKADSHPLLAALGYVFWGAVCGAISLAIFPNHMVAGQVARWANLLLTPVAVGFSMMAMTAWRNKTGASVSLLDRFFHGYLFALTLAVVRHLGAN
jgi:hypothetical protein